MAYTSPLGRLPTKLRQKEATQALIPEHIRLPDGRTVATRDITNQLRNRKTINLQTQAVHRIPEKPKTQRPRKYTIEERIWQSRATAEEIAERYGISLKTATSMTYTARYIIQRINQDEDSSA